MIKDQTYPPGTCMVCGCTETLACFHPTYGPCFWADETKTICSHCVEFPSDSRVIRPADLERVYRERVVEQIHLP